MGEIKSVKVDNWGVFFLQKLQNFFNKTDYCDLTLQFRDNSQLKVHRLVLSACTDYFNVLEQTCEVIDDAIIMPNGLQADVVVPIVNFMYTGTLEFELKMYNRLLRTAKDMNMTVLLKLLEAHRRTMEMHPPKAANQTSPKPRRRQQAGLVAGNSASNTAGRSLIQGNQVNKRIVVGTNVNRQPTRTISTSNTAPRPSPVRQIGSTTFTRVKVENDQQDSSRPLTASGGYSLIKQSHHQQATSPFEQLRKGYNNNKRPAVASFVSPPAKKPNLEDVKEFAEQQRMRKQIAAEYGDDDYDASNIMDDDTIHNDDDDDEMTTSGGQAQSSQTTGASISAGVQTMASSSSQQTQSEDPPGTTTIIVKHEGPNKPPTIVVKDNPNSKMNHAKIISEVLRQYPHLVRSNKNIKLKIMPNAGGQAQKIIVKKEPIEAEKQIHQAASKASIEPKVSESQQRIAKTLETNIIGSRPKPTQQQVEVSPTGGANKPNIDSSTTSTQSAGGQPQKRRIDSKTMHALIALGAENVTGPWLCLRCGRNGHPISIPSYRGFRRHLINTHKEVIDPALCEHCGWRSNSKRELHFHMQLEHKIKTSLYIFPECQLCQQMCIDSDGLNQHLIDSHPDENKQQCIYCNKIFPEEMQLYTHMKTFHKKQALEDGIIDYSDDEVQKALPIPPLEPIQYETEQKELPQQKKVKILSDISLPITSSIMKTQSFEQQTSAATEEYLQEQEHDEDNSETKFVAADGSEVILTPEQRKEILSQLNQEHDGSGVVMVLNDSHQQQQFVSSEMQSDQGAISQDETSQATTVNEEREEEEHVAEDDELHDDNQIYNEMKSLHSNLDDSTTESDVDGKQATDHVQRDADAEMDHGETSEHLEESKESMDNLEWAENLISEHDLADDVSSQNVKEEKEEIKDDDKSQDEISRKLKELTGDWSEDDDDDDDDVTEEERAPEISPIKESVVKPESSITEEAEPQEAEKKETEKETEELAKDQEESPEFEDHAALLASLQSSGGKDDQLENKEKLETDNDCENMDEDDIDFALKSLHKEDVADEKMAQQNFEDSEKKEKATKESIPKVKESENTETQEETSFKESTAGIEGDDEKPEEKLVKELANIGEPDVTTSAMEVDKETEKNIENLLSGQVETMDNKATEMPCGLETVKSVKVEDEQETKTSLETVKEDECSKTAMSATILGDSKPEESNDEEFLDITPGEQVTSSDNVAVEKAISSVATSPSEAVATDEPSLGKLEASSTKQPNTTTSSEEQVKSLISEWGDDDDEDEDDNDADLTANL